jgi:hypothetical protein
MSTEAMRAQVLAANRRFYDALESLDMGQMEAVWDTGPDAACLHPGSDWQHGWDDVRAGWGAVMTATGYIEFEIRDARARVVDPVAWVTCIERITSSGPQGPSVAEVAATNVFVLDATGWHLTVHHASPIIRPAPAPVEE